MRRGFKCKESIFEILKEMYDNIVKKDYNNNYITAIQSFNNIAENKLRNILKKQYKNNRSGDQAWKTCKGALYEYAVLKCLQQAIRDNGLSDEILVLRGDDALNQYKDQIAISNWADIFPDVDILVIDKRSNLVKAIISCKTSLRERLTETAFWKRELEKTKSTKNIKVIFITTDKDSELTGETNRYILLHVIDCTFITDLKKYEEIIEKYRKKYGNKKDFHKLLSKIRHIKDIGNFLKAL